MKIRITFKTPDAVFYALEEVADTEDLAPIKKAIDKFIKWDEQVTIEVDTETSTAIVIPVNS